jgi:hypothetical protein
MKLKYSFYNQRQSMFLLYFYLFYCGWGSIVFGKEVPQVPPPTFADVSYGPHARNVLDFWKAEGVGPRPLLVYIHGGGWLTGDKRKKGPDFQPYLDKGISFAAINYRLTPEYPLPAPIHDAARAIQFLRTKAKEWNI